MAARNFHMIILRFAGVLASIGSTAIARESSAPPHLQAAGALLSAIEPSDTNYQHKDSVVHFPGDGGSDHDRVDLRVDSRRALLVVSHPPRPTA